MTMVVDKIPFEKGTHTHCAVEGCTRKGHIKRAGRAEVFRQGYCVYHYYRFMTYGDPNLGKITGKRSKAKKHPLYGSWHGMVQRTSNPNNQDFQYYQARGITMYSKWEDLDGFDRFCQYMGPKPTPQHSLDRIDNDGNYEPGNVRWANKHQQMCNTRSASKSHPGVRYVDKRDTWSARIKIDKKSYYLGEHKSLEAAKAARKAAETYHNIKI